METKRIPDYPNHPEPTEAAAEYDREENPRAHPWTYVGGGLLLLLFLAIVMPWIWTQLAPQDWFRAHPKPMTTHQKPNQ